MLTLNELREQTNTYGFYFGKYGHFQRFMFILDIYIMALILFSFGLLFSSILNNYLTRTLNRSLGKIIIFLEVVSEAFMTILIIYSIKYFSSFIPSLLKNPPEDHSAFRLICGDYLLLFAIIACQLRLLDKIRYVFNDPEDEEIVILNDVRGNWNTCNNQGFQCNP